MKYYPRKYNNNNSLGFGLFGLFISFIISCNDFSKSQYGKKSSDYLTKKQKDYENEFGIIEYQDKNDTDKG